MTWGLVGPVAVCAHGWQAPCPIAQAREEPCSNYWQMNLWLDEAGGRSLHLQDGEVPE
jgi:hypothetical protein